MRRHSQTSSQVGGRASSSSIQTHAEGGIPSVCLIYFCPLSSPPPLAAAAAAVVAAASDISTEGAEAIRWRNAMWTRTGSGRWEDWKSRRSCLRGSRAEPSRAEPSCRRRCCCFCCGATSPSLCAFQPSSSRLLTWSASRLLSPSVCRIFSSQWASLLLLQLLD